MHHKSHQQKGAAMLLFVLFFVASSTSLAMLLAFSVFSDLRSLNVLSSSKQAYLTSESLAEDITLRYVFGTYDITSPETLEFAGATAHATSVEDTLSGEVTINVSSSLNRSIRKSQVELTIGAGAEFNYGLQAGNGGITMSNSAGVVGNVYANGPVVGGGSSLIRGDVVSAGPTGLISKVHATGSAWANTLDDSLIEKYAYYNNVGDPSTVTGTPLPNRFTPYPNQPTTTLPISTTTIKEWKDAVVAYGTMIASTSPECSSGTYTIDDPATIGYLKVECNLDVMDQGSPATVVTMTGPVWVEGNISFTQGPTIEVDPSLGRRSTQFIADDESNRLTSSQIEIRNSTNFAGSGDPRSLVLLLSQNESAEQGGSEVAITISQSANGDVMMYSNFGEIDIANNIDLKEVTAYHINIGNNADVFYDEGLKNQLFTSGPGGAYILADWRETF